MHIHFHLFSVVSSHIHSPSINNKARYQKQSEAVDVMREGVIDEPQVLVMLGEDKLRTRGSCTTAVDAPCRNYPLYGRVELIILPELVHMNESLTFRELDWLFAEQRPLVSSASKILLWGLCYNIAISRAQP